MKITLVDKKCPVSSDEQAIILRRLRNSLGRFDAAISRLIVFVELSDSPRGFPERTCRMVAGTRFGPPIIFTELGTDTLEVVSQAAGQLAHAMRRATELHGWH